MRPFLTAFTARAFSRDLTRCARCSGVSRGSAGVVRILRKMSMEVAGLQRVAADHLDAVATIPALPTASAGTARYSASACGHHLRRYIASSSATGCGPVFQAIAANKARDHLRSRVRRREVPLATKASGDDASEVSYLDFLADDQAGPGLAMPCFSSSIARKEHRSHASSWCAWPLRCSAR